MQCILQGVHPQGHVHSRTVGEEGSQSRLNKQTEDQDPVPVEQKFRAEKLRSGWTLTLMCGTYYGLQSCLDCQLIFPQFTFIISAHLLHALLKERVPPGLADDKIRPLNDHNAGEKGCVAGELHNLPLLVGLRCTDKCCIYLMLRSHQALRCLTIC